NESIGSELEYFWRTKAYMIPDDTVSGYSQVWSFTVDASAPVSYTLQVSDDSLFSGGPEFYEYTGISDTIFTIPDTLADSTVYYWRVKALADGGYESEWQEHPFQFTAIQFIRGDANGDGVINSADIIYLVNYLFAGGPVPVPFEAGDANCDEVTDSADVVYLINYLFAGGPPPGC
ncbi:MAG: dockerin type I repeat-containing protein, partial [Candidatus Zixiibacteriota bacterium]